VKTEVNKVIYVMEAGAQLMDKIRRECSCWADGDENICMTFEDAITNKELRRALKPYKGGCDVIVSE
jgi:hypothetical protein